jgi:hypothetical protein
MIEFTVLMLTNGVQFDMRGMTAQFPPSTLQTKEVWRLNADEHVSDIW